MVLGPVYKTCEFQDVRSWWDSVVSRVAGGEGRRLVCLEQRGGGIVAPEEEESDLSLRCSRCISPATRRKLWRLGGCG